MTAGLFDARLAAYEPGGPRLGVLPEPISFDAAFTLNDVGALTVTYSALALNGSFAARPMPDGLEIALEVATHDGGWAEPANGRFVMIRRDTNKTDDAELVTLTCPSYGFLLGHARIMGVGGGPNGDWPFAGTTVGGIMASLLDHNAGLGGVRVAAGFTAERDSAGALWFDPETDTALPPIFLRPGLQFSTLLEDMAGNGLCDWATSGRSLLMFRPHTALEGDRGCRLWLGNDVMDAPTLETLEEVASRVLLMSNTGVVMAGHNPAAPAPYGEFQQFITPSDVRDGATAGLFVDAELERREAVRAQYTRQLVLAAPEFWPLVDYRPGDWITAPTDVPAELVRVQQVTLSFNAEGLTGSLVLNDRVLDREIRTARRIKGLAGGSSLGALPFTAA